MSLSSGEGHEWCIEQMKLSSFAYLASELEMAKTVQLMWEGKLVDATKSLNAFVNKVIILMPLLKKGTYTSHKEEN